MEFSFNIEEKNTANIIHLSGNLIDKNHGDGLRQAVDDLLLNDSKKFIIDMKDLKYMNSTGLGVLITILTKARKSSGEAVICCVAQKIKELLIMTKLNTVFISAETIDEGIKKLNTKN